MWTTSSSINRTGIELQSGNFSSWFANFERQQASELAQNERLKRDDRPGCIRRPGGPPTGSNRAEASKYGGGPVDRGYIGHKSAKMMKRARSLEARQQRAIEEKSGLLRNLERAETLKLAPRRYFADTLATFSGVVPVFDGREVCQPVSFDIRNGERIALDGRNGSGKSSLLKLLLGQPVDHRGRLYGRLGTGAVLCAAGYRGAVRLAVRFRRLPADRREPAESHSAQDGF